MTSGLFPGLSSPEKCHNKIPGLSRFSRISRNPGLVFPCISHHFFCIYSLHTFLAAGSAGGGAGSGSGSGCFMGDNSILPTFLRSCMRCMALPTCNNNKNKQSYEQQGTVPIKKD